MNQNKLKLMDALLVWGICFLLFNVGSNLLSGVLGIGAYYLMQIVSGATVLFFARRTGFRLSKLLAGGKRSVREIFGSTLVWVGCLLVVIPLFLFSHLLVPALAETSFHVYDTTSSHLAVVGLILVAGMAECLLFDCFLYPRLQGMGAIYAWLPYLILGIMGGLYHPDLYILLPMGGMAVGFAYIRSKTHGFALPLILRCLTILMTLAFMQVSSASGELAGNSMGIVQVIGFSLIFWGASLPALFCGAGLLRQSKERSIVEITMLIAVSVVLIASGCGISTI